MDKEIMKRGRLEIRFEMMSSVRWEYGPLDIPSNLQRVHVQICAFSLTLLSPMDEELRVSKHFS
jgi:hypothetical protein